MIQKIALAVFLIAGLTLGIAAADQPPSKLSPLPQSVLARVVFLGDSVTDGNTYPQLVRDSLAKSTGIRMVAICAGAGGDTMQKMHARLQHAVLDYNPTLVTISSGDNDTSKGVTADQYEAEMRATVDTLRADKIDVILLTPIWQPVSKATTDLYEARVRKIAADYHLRVAETTQDMIDAEAAGLHQHSLDNHHPGYTGQHTIARSLLDAMGYADVPVIDKVNAELDPDVIRDWTIRPAVAADLPLTDAKVAALTPDATWKTVKAPFGSIDTTGSNYDSMAWLDDFRREGMATQLNKNVALGSTFICVATMTVPRDVRMYLQTGGETNNVWVNGAKVETLTDTPYLGWHPGRDLVVVTLTKGENKIVALTSTDLWVRIAPHALWRTDSP